MDKQKLTIAIADSLNLVDGLIEAIGPSSKLMALRRSLIAAQQSVNYPKSEPRAPIFPSDWLEGQ